MKTNEARSTIGLKLSTKSKLDRNRAPGQCYDGFLCQLVDMWEEANKERGYRFPRNKIEHQKVNS